jgi:drug/metabolite transporter (DMT)-like permease
MQDARLPRNQALLLFAAVIFAWGFGWPVGKAILASVSPLWTAAIRSAIGALVLFALAGWRGRIALPRRADMPVVLNIGLLHMVAYSGLVALGLRAIPAGRSVVLGYTTLLWVAPGASLFLGEPMTRARLAGVVLGLVGLGVLFNPLAFDWGDRTAVIGNGLILLAALIWAVSILHVRAHRWVSTPLALAPWEALIATLALGALALAFEELPAIVWTPRLTVLFAYAGTFGVALAYWAMAMVNRSLPAVTTGLGTLGVPVVGTLSSAFALHERIDAALALAMVLIIGGIVIGTLPSRAKAD